MTTLAPETAWPRLRLALQRHGIAVSTALLLAAYLWLDATWRESLKVALVFVLASYPLSRLLRGRARTVLYGGWVTLLALQTGVTAFLRQIYQTEPDAVLVISSISNSNVSEALEFVSQYAPLLLHYALLIMLPLLLLLWWLRPPPPAAPLPRAVKLRALAVAGVFALLHFNPTFRDSNPAFFWPGQWQRVQVFQQQISHLQQKRALAAQSLPQWAPAYVGPAQHTVAVVIGESTSRWNWQLYGYPRHTTPQLLAATGDALIFRDVIAAAWTTVDAFRLMLSPTTIGDRQDDEAEPSVVMLAKAAGYKTYWISNQQDHFINTRYAAEADVVHLANAGQGRGNRKLDADVLPYWDAALRDPAPRKMIFVHLLGAHAHYDLRAPEAYDRFSGQSDPVMQQMKQDGRSLWVRTLRNSYDNAMLYQDFIIARLLSSLKDQLGADGSGAFLYTPDHAEEVGHTRDFAGHTASESGYVVPLIVWTSQQRDAATRQALERRPFQSDVLDWTLLGLAHIHTRHDRPQDDLLSPRFRPRPRRIEGQLYRAVLSRG